MALKVELVWHKPIDLGAKAKFIARLEAVLDDLPEEPGIYVFARKFGGSCIPIYIGRATVSLHLRIKQQANNLKLMTAIRDEKNGNRMLLIATLKTSKGKAMKKALAVAEKAHIEHALTAGYPLVNVAGTKSKNHRILVYGTLSHMHPFPREMLVATSSADKQ